MEARLESEIVELSVGLVIGHLSFTCVLSDGKDLGNSGQSVLNTQSKSKKLGSLRTSVFNGQSVLSAEPKLQLGSLRTSEQSVLSGESKQSGNLRTSEQSVLSGEAKPLENLLDSLLNTQSESQLKVGRFRSSGQSALSSQSKMQEVQPWGRTPSWCKDPTRGDNADESPPFLPTIDPKLTGDKLGALFGESGGIETSCLVKLPANWVPCPSRTRKFGACLKVFVFLILFCFRFGFVFFSAFCFFAVFVLLLLCFLRRQSLVFVLAKF